MSISSCSYYKYSIFNTKDRYAIRELMMHSHNGPITAAQLESGSGHDAATPKHQSIYLTPHQHIQLLSRHNYTIPNWRDRQKEKQQTKCQAPSPSSPSTRSSSCPQTTPPASSPNTTPLLTLQPASQQPPPTTPAQTHTLRSKSKRALRAG